MKPKPHLRCYGGIWRCSGPPQRNVVSGNVHVYYPFPWGMGETREAAYAAWQRLQHRPTTSTLFSTGHDRPN